MSEALHAPQPRYGWHGAVHETNVLDYLENELWREWGPGKIASAQREVPAQRDVKYIAVSRDMAERLCGDGWSQAVEIRFEQDPYDSALLVMWMRTC